MTFPHAQESGSATLAPGQLRSSLDMQALEGTVNLTVHVGIGSTARSLIPVLAMNQERVTATLSPRLRTILKHALDPVLDTRGTPLSLRTSSAAAASRLNQGGSARVVCVRAHCNCGASISMDG